ncbi:hypothetical protein A2833_03015 [Candidatus Azambacteria bacterium RIFCSPHIGHO2_01_FULL_44_55]|uniref:AAA+ ATPase domain-containing protein n=1 Tax=Candidatus Azambacteria bacterium RIFCSPLOWO2_02_FULL_44_14 TaxID=1797306 RepID=A0A1F5CBN8_9BACT|nr:MAG: hypothetical protein A3A18_02330 [Candidatus Azambacteria bacterium RIFCSPLOWO2_01_FULL_44_84]OGD33075.1 MAG: hypothetical protein A3C78_01655 [Candidatus Azambacteria bacterium RIFCSPHIGHO2_02_FULL_45_18]OGD40228.1 MAG: hypothetical protein A3I30_02710 [Candidatus Azambacteria bacterium RIFCSPLOWO2_02_FULL_44_14]OGD41725.1 MAG: hypothetical protein A2833_03015 [Candidatus Azambacteria bacterium RIFCSPHIGHO2_01_FULL_44_55]OGD49967.1 MAG: hypothetical protein A2608_01120 [Candidatus Azam
MQKVIVGQEEMVNCYLAALIIGGHIWSEGPPGVGKTLGARTFAKILDIEFKAIQFTPDLLPTDIKIAVDLLSESDSGDVQGEAAFLLKKVIRGVVFTNFLLVDEANRAPQKVQAALLEVMQEREVKTGAKTHKLDRPYMVALTSNFIEHEGTYGISEALADRVTLKTRLDYPSFEEECRVAAMRKDIEADRINLKKVFTKEEIVEMQDLFDSLYRYAPNHPLTEYAVGIARAVRVQKDFVTYGPTPRGSADLLVSASALAMIEGTLEVSPDHVKKMALSALRGTFNLKADPEHGGKDHDQIITEAIESVKVFSEKRS